MGDAERGTLLRHDALTVSSDGGCVVDCGCFLAVGKVTWMVSYVFSKSSIFGAPSIIERMVALNLLRQGKHSHPSGKSSDRLFVAAAMVGSIRNSSAGHCSAAARR